MVRKFSTLFLVLQAKPMGHLEFWITLGAFPCTFYLIFKLSWYPAIFYTWFNKTTVTDAKWISTQINSERVSLAGVVVAPFHQDPRSQEVWVQVSLLLLHQHNTKKIFESDIILVLGHYINAQFVRKITLPWYRMLLNFNFNLTSAGYNMLARAVVDTARRGDRAGHQQKKRFRGGGSAPASGTGTIGFSRPCLLWV